MPAVTVPVQVAAANATHDAFCVVVSVTAVETAIDGRTIPAVSAHTRVDVPGQVTAVNVSPEQEAGTTLTVVMQANVVEHAGSAVSSTVVSVRVPPLVQPRNPSLHNGKVPVVAGHTISGDDTADTVDAQPN